MTTRLRLAIAPLILACLVVTGAGPKLIEPSWVSVIFVDCGADKEDRSTISINPLSDSLKRHEISPIIQSLAPDVDKLDFQLDPGDWWVEVGRKCGSGDEVTVLPNLSRHVVFVGRQVKILGPSCSVSGALPVPGLFLRLVSRSGQVLPIAVDGNAYYSGQFGRGTYHLEVGAMQGLTVNIPLDYSDQQGGEFCDKKIVRDITFDDLRSISAK